MRPARRDAAKLSGLAVQLPLAATAAALAGIIFAGAAGRGFLAEGVGL